MPTPQGKLCYVLLLAAAAPAAAVPVTLDFAGFIEPGGGYFLNADNAPVAGTLTFDSDVPAAQNLPNGVRYVDPAGTLTADFGPGGTLASFTAVSDLFLEVTHVSGNTRLYAEAFDSPTPGVGDKVSLTLILPGLNALGPGFPLPDAAPTLAQLSSARGGIEGGGALSTFTLTAVPEPTSGVLLLGGLGTCCRRRRA